MGALLLPVIARLVGRCANGAERDGGIRSHVLMAEGLGLPSPCYATAICGAKPGRLSNGWEELDGAERPTCSRCERIAARQARELEARR